MNNQLCDTKKAALQAEKTETKAKLADRLINGLSGENKRWSETVKVFDVKAGKLVGDVLIAASFVSYCGPFNMQFRNDLVVEKWLKDLVDKKIPMTDGVRPLDQLSSNTEKAQWGNEGLPTDPLSIENGAIMMSSSRTTLMIDPQLQARASATLWCTCVDVCLPLLFFKCASVMGSSCRRTPFFSSILAVLDWLSSA